MAALARAPYGFDGYGIRLLRKQYPAFRISLLLLLYLTPVYE